MNLCELLLQREQLRIGRRGVENGRLGREHQVEEQSVGVYRIPYANGTDVEIWLKAP